MYSCACEIYAHACQVLLKEVHRYLSYTCSSLDYVDILVHCTWICLYMCVLGKIKSPIGTKRNLPPLKGAQSAALGPQYEWVDVGMLDYDHEMKLYHVKRVFVPNKVLGGRSSTLSIHCSETSGGESNGSDSDGEETCNGIKGHIDSIDNIHYWVPRVRIMFAAENPVLFAERVANSYNLRERTEALLRYCTMLM